MSKFTRMAPVDLNSAGASINDVVTLHTLDQIVEEQKDARHYDSPTKPSKKKKKKKKK